MKKNVFINSRNFHILGGCAAAVLALRTARKNKWRYPLFALAGWEMWKGLSSSTENGAKIIYEKAPEIIRTDAVKGIVMRWEEHGDPSAESVPIILVHGLPTNPRAWRYVIPQVAEKGIRCLAWEQVGFGWSMIEGLGLDISIPKQAEYLYGWLQHLGITKAVFVGHDYGGGVIQQLLINHPELAIGLVLSDSVAYNNWPVTAIRIARSMAGVIEHLPPAMVKPIFLAGISNLGHENAVIKEEAVDLYWAPYNRTISPKAFAHQLRHFSSKDTEAVEPLLYRIQVPAGLYGVIKIHSEYLPEKTFLKRLMLLS